VKLYPVDPALAAEVAEAGETTLIALGLEKPPTPLPPDRIVDSVVCAAADAMEALPRLVRPGLLAAVVRARELGIGLETIEAALTPPESAAPPREAPRSRSRGS